MQFIVEIMLKNSQLIYIINHRRQLNERKIRMKKLISAALAAILIAATFCACSSKPTAELTEANITKTIDTAFTALREVDEEALGTYVNASSLKFLLGYTKKYTQFDDLGKAMFANLTYEIKSIDVQGQTAVISVNNKDLSEISSEFTQSLTAEYSTLELLKKLSDEQWLDDNLASLTSKIDAAQMKEQPAEITVKIEQAKDHLVLFFGVSEEDAISGGALGAIMSAIY